MGGGPTTRPTGSQSMHAMGALTTQQMPIRLDNMVCIMEYCTIFFSIVHYYQKVMNFFFIWLLQTIKKIKFAQRSLYTELSFFYVLRNLLLYLSAHGFVFYANHVFYTQTSIKVETIFLII